MHILDVVMGLVALALLLHGVVRLNQSPEGETLPPRLLLALGVLVVGRACDAAAIVTVAVTVLVIAINWVVPLRRVHQRLRNLGRRDDDW